MTRTTPETRTWLREADDPWVARIQCVRLPSEGQ
jgi:hypothetical protein